jgi:hypothetical protein
MILYLKYPKNSTKKLLKITKSFGKVAGYKNNIQKPVAFLNTNNEQTEKEIRETIPVTISSKLINYFKINLMKKTKHLFNEHYKPTEERNQRRHQKMERSLCELVESTL